MPDDGHKWLYKKVESFDYASNWVVLLKALLTHTLSHSNYSYYTDVLIPCTKLQIYHIEWEIVSHISFCSVEHMDDDILISYTISGAMIYKLICMWREFRTHI